MRVVSVLSSYRTIWDFIFPLKSFPSTRKSNFTLSSVCWSIVCYRIPLMIWLFDKSYIVEGIFIIIGSELEGLQIWNFVFRHVGDKFGEHRLRYIINNFFNVISFHVIVEILYILLIKFIVLKYVIINRQKKYFRFLKTGKLDSSHLKPF